MTSLGQVCLLAAMAASGYSAFACAAGGLRRHRGVSHSGVWAGVAAAAALTAAAGVLAWALVRKDFRFQYVLQYSDSLLPWQYSLSAFWVGQGGSLLLWAWLVAVLALAYFLAAESKPAGFRELVFGLLMGSCCFLAVVIVFAADPMQPSPVVRATGDGLSASLQHPAMLIHPPVIFLGYAAWGIPFAAALAALLSGRLDGGWIRHARGWALAAWAILGVGILVGADWAYEELGWGGYWSWDPVENGSLMPWLTGTVLVHCMMTWQNSGILKKTTLALAIVTFALCNFAAFLTRSGVFSSLHAFSQSPIGWMFLAWMAVLLLGSGWLMLRRRAALAAERAIAAWSSREGLIVLTAVALGLLTAVTLLGTSIVPLSRFVFGRQIVVGAAFYNDVLAPIGLLLLAAVAATPLLRWGGPPGGLQKKMLFVAAACGLIAAAVAWLCGQPRRWNWRVSRRPRRR